MMSLEQCRCVDVTGAVSLRGGADAIMRCLDVIGVSLAPELLSLKLESLALKWGPLALTGCPWP